MMSTSPADFNAQVIDEFHANQGRVGGDWEGWPLLLLHHTGARSGRHLVNPLGFVSDGGRYVVCASHGGARSSPGWYHNLKAHPNAMIEVLTETILVRASEASGEERDRLWRASVENAPQLGEYAHKAGRTIPVIVLTPTEPEDFEVGQARSAGDHEVPGLLLDHLSQHPGQAELREDAAISEPRNGRDMVALKGQHK